MDTIIEETSAKGERETIDKNNDTAKTCSKDNTPEDGSKEPNEDATSCSKDTTPNNGTKEPNGDAMPCSKDTTPNDGTKELNEDDISCSQDTTTTTGTKEPDGDVLSCSQDTTTTTGTKEPDGDVLSCSQDTTTTTGTKEPDGDVLSCSQDTTTTTGTKEPDGDVLSCSQDTTTTTGTKEPDGDVLSCSQDTTTTTGTKEPDGDVLSCSQDTTTTTGTKEPDGDVLSCNQDTTTTTGTKEPDGDVLSCNQDTTTTTGTKKPDGNVLSCSQDTTPSNGTKEPNRDASPINRKIQPNEDAMSKNDTEKLNVKVDTKLTETLAEAKSDTVENQERTQDLGFDCRSRVPEKTVNSKEKKKQTKQEKKKHKDDKTYSVPQNMYRGNDQSYNVDKRRGRFKDKKGEPGICGTKEEFVFFWKSQSPYSQWYISDFTVNGTTFNCAEQYMMYSKAMLFDDKETADLILQESDPRNHKSLGRRVQNFDQKKWDKNCIDIVKCGNKAKFSQDKRLYKMIIDTHPKTLVEASPMDRIWGIGLAADDYRAQDRKKWRGKNLLGKALTEVRNELKQEEESGKHDKRDTASQNISETGTDNDDTQGSTDDRLKDETENTQELKAKTTVPETGDMTGENNPLESCNQEETSQSTTSDATSDLPPSNIDVKSQVSTIKQVEKSQVSTIKQVEGDKTVATDNGEN